MQALHIPPLGIAESNYWTVTLNDVEIGQLGNLDYTHIRSKIRRDKRLYLVQAVRLASLAFRVFRAVVIAVPVMAFWFAVYFWMLHTGQAIALMRVLLNVPPALAASYGFILSQCVAAGACLTAALTLSVWGRNFKDPYEEAVETAIRLRFNVPANGKLRLTMAAS